jgi:hypothetical protein
MRIHCLTAQGARWRTSCVQSEKMPHARPALHSRRAQQFAKVGCRMRLEDAGQTFIWCETSFPSPTQLACSDGLILIGERGV